MIFTNLWRFWTDSWSSAKRARLLYGVFTLGFIGLAIGGAVKDDGTVMALGIAFALVTAALAFLAPKLSNLGRDTRHDVS